MGHDLEYPGVDGISNWDNLYRARGREEIMPHRPVFTGDVFQRVTVHVAGGVKSKSVMIVQHPCALRTNGIDLVDRLIVAEVRTHKLIETADWVKHLAKMPLPDLVPTVDSGKRNQAAFFDSPYIVSAEDLAQGERVACLSQVGVNLLLQRWVNHNSRAVIPTFVYQEVTSPAYEEADLIEYWCEERAESGIGTHAASSEALEWLRQDGGGGVMRQTMLENPQNRSTVRRDMRAELRKLR